MIYLPSDYVVYRDSDALVIIFIIITITINISIMFIMELMSMVVWVGYKAVVIVYYLLKRLSVGHTDLVTSRFCHHLHHHHHYHHHKHEIHNGVDVEGGLGSGN
jgi:hypothetical protein